MRYGELIQIFFERHNELQTLWTIYVTLTGALLAFLATRRASDKVLGGVLVVVFLMFACVNLSAMLDVTAQRRVLAQAIIQHPLSSDEAWLDTADSSRALHGKAAGSLRTSIQESVYVPPNWQFIVFHVMADGLVLLGVAITGFGWRPWR